MVGGWGEGFGVIVLEMLLVECGTECCEGLGVFWGVGKRSAF